MTVKLGKDAVLYYGTTGATGAIEATSVGDVSVAMTAGEAKIPTRGNGGINAVATTLLEIEVTFKIPLDPSDAFYQAVRVAFVGRTTMALKPMTGSNSVAGNEGPDGDFVITKFDRAEPIDGEVSMDCTAKIQVFRSWVVVASGS